MEASVVEQLELQLGILVGVGVGVGVGSWNLSSNTCWTLC